ncbi:MAG: hypothetical protein DLM53_12095 [Candidatus Eremiobacter antarcticus]|nr:phosphatidate cytidylyltransferase [Candidatus Eremiobacteraeota bacterium]MBC5808920.1 phosphatidate cytidylyltransferase [Candidatus Eremiobacteraeota bacterium]PZR60396.1 MAG: hypothetical protein DLM53_12095 [Candidatus Eremiobacter sp. RRmetagenome_bin22]
MYELSTAATAGKPEVAARLRRGLSLKRVIIGILVAALGVGSVFVAPAFTVVVVLIAVIGAVEFTNLAQRAGADISLPVAAAACAAYPLLASAGLLTRWEPALVSIIVIASFLASLTADLERFAGRCAMTVLASLYLGKLLSYFVLLRGAHNGLTFTVWLIVVVALTDIAAMVAGLQYGRHRMAPRLSPSKTWEGAAAALLVATLVGAAMGLSPFIGVPWWLAFLFPLCVSVAAAIGDLVESALKRNAQVKDSGHIIAGHGGVLDRFDSYIFAGVVGYAVLLLAGRL